MGSTDGNGERTEGTLYGYKRDEGRGEKNH